MVSVKQNIILITRVVCAVLFCTFTFLFLYSYQADILSVIQYILSGGATRYEPTIGAFLITLILYLLHLGVYTLTRLNCFTHALTYFPSLLILVFITDISPDVTKDFSFGIWVWIFPISILLWVAAVWYLKRIDTTASANCSGSFIIRVLWINSAVLSLMFLLVGLSSNGNDVFHYRMRMENCLIEKKYDAAIMTGRKSLACDSSLTMLRAYALSCKGELGERLFEFPLEGGSKALLPDGQTVKSIMYPASKIRAHYRKKKYHADYELCSLLLDRRIDEFAESISKYYNINDKLPKHYREALLLYTHMRSNPVVEYHNDLMNADFQDLQEMEKKTADVRKRINDVYSTFGNTYWYYYEYGNKVR